MWRLQNKNITKRITALFAAVLLFGQLILLPMPASAATTIAITSPVANATTGASFTVSGTATPNRKIEVKINGTAVGSTTSNSGGAWTLDVTGQNDGPKTIEATASTQLMYTNILNVADFSASRMSRINTLTNTEESSFSIYGGGAFPITWKPNPAFTKAYGVAPYLNSPTVWVMDLVNGSTTTFPLPGAGQRGASVAYNTDGSRVYITDNANTTVWVYNTADNSQVGSGIAVGASPHSNTKRPEHDEVWIDNSGNNTVSVINTNSNTVTATYTGFPGANGLAFSPDGNLAYVGTTVAGGTIQIADADTGNIIDSIAGTAGAEWLTINSDGTRLYASHPTTNTIDVFNLSSRTLITSVVVGDGPWGMALNADNSVLYVAKPNLLGSLSGTDIALVDTATNTVTSNITPGGGAPFFIWAAPTESGSATINITVSSSALADTGVNATLLMIVATSLVACGVLGVTYRVARRRKHTIRF